MFFTKFFSFVLGIFGIEFHLLVYYMLCFFFILPIVLWNNIGFFTRISVLGLVLGLASILGTIGYEGSQLFGGATAIDQVSGFHFGQTFSCIAVFITSIEGTMVYLPIREKMQKPEVSSGHHYAFRKAS